MLFLRAFSYNVAWGDFKAVIATSLSTPFSHDCVFMFYSTAKTISSDQLKIEELKTNIYFPKKKLLRLFSLITIILNTRQKIVFVWELNEHFHNCEPTWEFFCENERKNGSNTLHCFNFLRTIFSFFGGKTRMNERQSKYPIFYLSKYFSLIMSLSDSCFNISAASESKQENWLILFPHIFLRLNIVVLSLHMESSTGCIRLSIIIDLPLRHSFVRRL